MSYSMQRRGLQHARLLVLNYLPELAQTHVHWVSVAIQPSHPLSPPSPPAFIFPASGSFPMSQFFVSGGQSIGVSASVSVLPMSIQDWFPLGLPGLILLFNRLLTVFSSTTVQKHQFFSLIYGPTLPSIHGYWINHSFDYTDLCWQGDIFVF